MPRDYYIVLGIAASASAEEIHAAFRRRSKELHPDVSGADSGPFLELQEAYSVLSDPLRRRDYDRESTARVDVRVTRRPPRESVVPLRSRVSDVMLRPRSAAEPIAPLRPNSVMNDFFSFGPSFDEFFDRGWSNFGSFVQPEGARTESLDVEVLVSAEEARRGGRVRFAMPARMNCPTCGGHGALAGLACWRCAGNGTFVAERSIAVDYPAGLREGERVRVPLHRFGIRNSYLTVVFRVAVEEVGSP